MNAEDPVVATLRRMFGDAQDRDAAERPSPDELDERLWSALLDGGYLEVLSGDPDDSASNDDGTADDLELGIEVARLAARFAGRAPVAEAVFVGSSLQRLTPGAEVGRTAFVRAGHDATTTPVRWGRVAEKVAVFDASGEAGRLRLYDAGQLTCRHGVNLAGEAWDSFGLDPAAQSVGEVVLSGEDARALRRAEDLARLGSLAGAAQAAHEATVDYARTREQFGRPLGSFQAVAHSIARMTADRAALDCAVRVALDAARLGLDGDLLHAAAVAQAVRVAGPIAAVAHQVHGAIGMTLEHSLRLSTTRLWSTRDALGSEAEAARTVAGAFIDGDPWAVLTATGSASAAAESDRLISR